MAQAEDFRVRVQAALSLGTSRAGKAVPPLCKALRDKNGTVRIASATALARLKKGGKKCLERQRGREKDARVLRSLIRSLGQLSGGAERTIGPQTRYLIAIKKLQGPGRLNGPVRDAFVKGAGGDKKVGFAPANLTKTGASRLLGRFKGAKGVLLAPKLSRPRYEGGELHIKISVAILSYPDGTLLGSFSKTAGASGVSSPDPQTENALVVAVAEASMKQFLSLAPQLPL